MTFSSIVFIFLFLPLFFVFYFMFKKRKTRNLMMLIFSLLFYGYGEPIYVFLMILSIVINYYFAILIDKKHSKKYLVLALIYNLGLLFIFKYSNFFLSNINNILNLSIPFLKITLPIGISFYTFQIITYIVDVYKRKVPVQKNIVNLGCYISAFPQLIAGPIVRYSDISDEIINRKENLSDFYDGVKRFIIGLAKKVIIANEMAYIADTIFTGDLVSVGFIGVLLAAICYPLQVYFDFSGYSDMAIGYGKMLGFHYLENFNYPFMADSITDFWKRWHISLSSFFRDYVYIPLGGNRCSRLRNIINILIVWLLTGLWHGANWNYILWGLYFGIFIILEKFVFNKILEKTPKFLKHIITLFVLCISFIVFYFNDFSLLFEALKSLFGGNGFGNIYWLYNYQILKARTIIIFIIGLLSSTPLLKRLYKDSLLIDIILIILFLISISFILVSSYNPFIYFRF